MSINERGEFIRDKDASSNPVQAEQKTEPAESFEIDYLNARAEISKGMQVMGFKILSQGSHRDGTVEFTGESTNGDGTTVTMTIMKGERYKSPKEVADAKQDKK